MKVKPNKNALILGLINYTKKQDTNIKIKEEQGITLEWTQKIRQNWTWFNKGGII